MKSLKLFFTTFIFTNISSCSNSEFNFDLLKNNINSEEGIIVSCIRCTCVVEELDSYYLVNDNFVTKVPLYADTNCLQPFLKKKINHLNQRVLDSIYEKNYNLILFKREGSTYNFKLVKTEDAIKFPQIAKAFFEK